VTFVPQISFKQESQNTSSMSYYQLPKITGSQLRQLAEILWCCIPCNECKESKACADTSCLSKRLKRLGPFFWQYEEVTATYQPEVLPGRQVFLRSHEDLFSVIKELKSNPDVRRADLTRNTVAGEPLEFAAEDRDHAIYLAVRVMFMIGCSTGHSGLGSLEGGPFQVVWPKEITFTQFFSNIFPETDHPALNDETVVSSYGMKTALTARKLQKRARLSFRPTNDLRRHLAINHKNNSVEIFHHTAFLKEHLRLTKGKPRDLSISESLKL
jgi:hypothetical protein